MKICFCNQDMSIGGSSTVIFEIIKNWPSTNDQLFLLLFFNNFDERYSLLKSITNLNIFFLKKTHTFDIPFLVRLKKKLKEISPDVISSHLTCTFYLSILRIYKNCDFYHTVHSIPNKDLPYLYRVFLKKRFLNKQIQLIGCCDFISKETSKLYKTSCFTINNGISLLNINLPAKTEKIFCSFLYVGRLVKMKNVEVIISAFKKVKNNNAKLIVCGTGPEKDNILELIGTDNRICFVGKQDNVDIVYKQSDVLCLVSDWEGLPMTILEGLNYNLAFICKNIGGISSYVENDINGYLLSDSDVEAELTKKMEFLADNLNRLNEMKTASSLIKERASAKTMALKYEQLFKTK